MPEPVTHWFTVPYFVVATVPPGRSYYPQLVMEQVALQLRSVEDGDAPPAFRVDWPDGRSLTWREHDGALWRPVVDNEWKSMTLDDLDARTKVAVRSSDLVDYPFVVQHPRYTPWSTMADNRVTPFGGMTRENLARSRIQADHHGEALVEAHRIAADDLLLVNGVLHLRSVAPVWTLGKAGPLAYSAHVVDLVLPDHPWSVVGDVLLPADRRDDAVVLSERVSDALAPYRFGEASRPTEAKDVEVTTFGGYGFASTHADMAARAARTFRECVAPVEIKHASRDLLKAVTRIEDLAEGIGADDDPDGMSELADAFRAMARLPDITGPTASPRIMAAAEVAAYFGEAVAFETERLAMDALAP